MDLVVYKILQRKLLTQSNISIKVSGNSMYPTFSDGDMITIFRESNYVVGDILVFWYKKDLLVHRLLKICDEIYLCKGDNSFRLESVEKEFVIGKVELINSNPVQRWHSSLIELSYLVNREFRNLCYDIEKTKGTGIYKFYRQTLLDVEDNTLKYKKIRSVSQDEINILNFNVRHNEIKCETILNFLDDKRTYKDIIREMLIGQSDFNQDLQNYIKEVLLCFVVNNIISVSVN